MKVIRSINIEEKLWKKLQEIAKKTSTRRKWYGLYKDYMRVALEKDDLEIELNKLKRGDTNESN